MKLSFHALLFACSASLLVCCVDPPRTYRIPVVINEGESSPNSMPPIAVWSPTAHVDCGNEPTHLSAPFKSIDTSTSPSPQCSCGDVANHSAPLVFGPDVTLTTNEHTVRVKGNGDELTTVHLPLASTVPGQRWTVKVWGDDANCLTFLPAISDDGIMDAMNDIDGDSLLDTCGLNPAIVIEAYVDQGDDGPTPGWMVLSR